MGLESKAQYFTMDALFAAIILVSGFMIINTMILDEEPEQHLEYLSQDLLVSLDQIPISAVNDAWVQSEIASKGITNPDNSILEQIAAYWATNESAKAQKLINISMGSLLPDTYGLRISMRPDELYSNNQSVHSSIIAGRRMISGIEKGEALEGSSGVGYLTSIHDKESSSYAYMGGFLGQGNFTVQLEDLPADVNSSRIKDIIVEGDFQREFTILINDIHCDNLTPVVGNLSADRWSVAYVCA